MTDTTAQLQACERRIEETSAQIAKVLASDIQGYPDRELQRRFLTHSEVAGSITDAALKKLRTDAGALGADLADRVVDTLADQALWTALLDAGSEVPGGKEFRSIAPVWAALGFIDADFEELASAAGLHDDRDPAGYAPPRRFVDRLYLPTLVETMLRELANLANLRVAASAEAEAETRDSLSARWAAAAPDE